MLSKKGFEFSLRNYLLQDELFDLQKGCSFETATSVFDLLKMGQFEEAEKILEDERWKQILNTDYEDWKRNFIHFISKNITKKKCIDIIKQSYEKYGEKILSSLYNIIERDDIELIKWCEPFIIENIQELNMNSIFLTPLLQCSINNNNFEIFKWLVNKKLQFLSDDRYRKYTMLKMVLLNGNFDMLKFIEEKNLLLFEQRALYAHDYLRYLNTNSENILKCLSYIIEKYPEQVLPFEQNNINTFVYIGAKEVLEWMLEKNYITLNNTELLTKSDDINYYKWLYEKGCRLTPKTYTLCVNIEISEWIFSKGIIPNSDSITGVINYPNLLQNLIWYFNHGLDIQSLSNDRINFYCVHSKEVLLFFENRRPEVFTKDVYTEILMNMYRNVELRDKDKFEETVYLLEKINESNNEDILVNTYVYEFIIMFGNNKITKYLFEEYDIEITESIKEVIFNNLKYKLFKYVI